MAATFVSEFSAQLLPSVVSPTVASSLFTVSSTLITSFSSTWSQWVNEQQTTPIHLTPEAKVLKFLILFSLSFPLLLCINISLFSVWFTSAVELISSSVGNSLTIGQNPYLFQ